MIVTPDFADHWKTRLLVELLSDEAAPMYVLRLWAHCQNRKTHVFHNLTMQALKALCRFSGRAEDLEAALLGAGFVRHEAGAMVVHQWDEYNAALIANWENGKKAGRPKGKSNPAADHGEPAANPQAAPGKAAANPPAAPGKSAANPQAVPGQPVDHAPVTGGEPMGSPRVTHGLPMAHPRPTHVTTHKEPIDKRREDREDREDGGDGEDTDCPEPEEPPSDSSEPEEPASEPAQEPILVFECVGFQKAWALSEEKLQEWQEVFPDIDVLAALRRARQWCIDNPAKRKTAGGMPRFINNWLGKAQDNGESRKGKGESRQAHGERAPVPIPRLPTSRELDAEQDKRFLEIAMATAAHTL